jgi:hypothetical protein
VLVWAPAIDLANSTECGLTTRSSGRAGSLLRRPSIGGGAPLCFDARRNKPFDTNEMLNYCSVFVGMWLLATSAGASSAALRDRELDDGLQGVWCISDDGGESCWGFEEYRKGFISSCGRKPNTQAVMTATLRYEVRGNRVCAVVTEASATYPLRPGGPYCITVLDVDGRTLQFRGVGSSATMTNYRVPRTSMRCPGIES